MRKKERELLAFNDKTRKDQAMYHLREALTDVTDLRTLPEVGGFSLTWQACPHSKP